MYMAIKLYGKLAIYLWGGGKAIAH